MNAQVQNHLDADSPTRKPRIVIAGEFSAGKSKLINGLLGREILASNVTSTSLPPVWLVGRGTSSFLVDLDGERHSISDLQGIDIANTLYCVISFDAPILEHFDLIDTPGNSDPNIPSVCWERMIEYADSLVWCTGAMQAWRQSEKSACKDLPEDLLQASTLLVTQADRMPDERSASKVLRRVTRDASSLFPEIKMGSLIRDEDVAEIREYLLALAPGVKLLGRDEPLVEAVRPAVQAPEPAPVPQAAFEAAPTVSQDASNILTGPWDMSADAIATAGIGTKLSDDDSVPAPLLQATSASDGSDADAPEAEVAQTEGEEDLLDAVHSALEVAEEKPAREAPPALEEEDVQAHSKSDEEKGERETEFEEDDSEPELAASALQEDVEAEASVDDTVETSSVLVDVDAPATIGSGEATAIWQEISQDVDLSSADAIKACVSTLLTRVDALLNECRGEAAIEAEDSLVDVKD